MELNFTLRNITSSSSIDGLSVVHKLKSPLVLKVSQPHQLEIMNNLWNLDKKKNLATFKTKILENFEEDEKFHLLIPHSHKDQFTREIKKYILENFPNCIDISSCFTKTLGVSFGSQEHSSKSIEQLKEYITVAADCFNNDTVISKVLIADDVYSSGKTMNVYESILRERIKPLEIIGGSLIRIKK
jgi:predicted amidophosphoribosyltransferase